MSRTLKAIVIAGLLTASVDAQTRRPQAFIEVLLNTFVQAQRTFDVSQLNEILAPDYVEISPAGEVDPRAEVLSFYAPEKKVADTPAAALDEISTRVYGETAVTIARLTYQMKGPDGAAIARSMRCVFVTRIVDRKWKLVSTQYTAIRK
jgi:ketosteroid isomerase-like protein